MTIFSRNFSACKVSISAIIAASSLAIAVQPANAQAQTDEQVADDCRPKGFFAVASYEAVEILEDGRVTFRLCAPDAQDVRVISSDIGDIIPMGFAPGSVPGLAMERDEAGLWSVTTHKAVPADTYRFNFQVDGARVPSPLAYEFSGERTGINSLFEVAGEAGEFQTWRADVAHGALSEIEYWSDSLGAKRRAHVYTPPGYMKGDADYPVLYLVHGAGDSDDSWGTVGRANYILDNLLAAEEAAPMIIVMPFGHTPPSAEENLLNNDDFGNDLIGDLIPYVDANFRTQEGAENRAMAGLSMGGAHTIRNGLPRSDLFDYVGIFSMGLGLGGEGEIAAYTQANDAGLKQTAEQMDLVYYAMGKDDFLYGSVAPTRAMMAEYGIEHVYNETEGGHTWINWRRYLHDFLPRLFR